MTENIDPQRPMEFGQSKSEGPECLANLIENHLETNRASLESETLRKESLLKISVDKEFAHIFHHETSLDLTVPPKIKVTPAIQAICKWLEEPSEYSANSYLPLMELPQLLHALHHKVSNNCIVITEYPHYYARHLNQMHRLSKLKWGILDASLDSQQKIKLLELFELNKIKLLLISPSLFIAEPYHSFESDLIVFSDSNLYKLETLNLIRSKIKVGRELLIYSTCSLLPNPTIYPSSSSSSSLFVLETGSTELTIKTDFKSKKEINDAKYKQLLAYLKKNKCKTLIIAKNCEINNLREKLSLEAGKVTCIEDHLSTFVTNPYKDNLQAKIQRDEEQLLKGLDSLAEAELILSPAFDFLKFLDVQLVVFYSFIEVNKIISLCPNTEHKLVLFDEDDYFLSRNLLTARLITKEQLEAVLVKLLESPQEKSNTTNFYSVPSEQSNKTLKMNIICDECSINTSMLNQIIRVLEREAAICEVQRAIYEIEIEEQSLNWFRKKFPQYLENRRKVPLLSVSTHYTKTTASILEELSLAGIRYKISEEIIQFTLIKAYEEVNSTILLEEVNANTLGKAKSFDLSFEILTQCSYKSIELMKRESVLRKKEMLFGIDLRKKNEVLNHHKESKKSGRPSISSLEIEEWMEEINCPEVGVKELVLRLQGVLKSPENDWSYSKGSQLIVNKYRRYRYEELFEVITNLLEKTKGNKKVKVE